MCKNCIGCCLVSALATWGFFALLLKLLNVSNALINAIWLTVLVFIAVCCCPAINSRMRECCQTKKKK